MNQYEPLKRISSVFCRLGSSYVYAQIAPTLLRSIPNVEPQKIDGMIMLLVREGEVTIEINFEDYVIGANSFTVIPYGALVQLKSSATRRIDAQVICFTSEFLHGVNINFSAISVPTFVDRQSPAQLLTKEEAELIDKYFGLLRDNAQSSVSEQIEISIASSLVAAMVYQLVQFHYKRIGMLEGEKGARSCRNAYVHDFMKLVHVHYSQERSVAFYADKLCISAKYLSFLVKDMTGKSAARWIDEFVLMEAKNMLRFSGKNVQQVAYALNFSNQSSFGKYFKHMTGMSPTEYQKS